VDGGDLDALFLDRGGELGRGSAAGIRAADFGRLRGPITPL